MLSSLFFVFVISFFGTPTPTQASTPVACTMDAKLCPDGVTYVGRDGNRNCQWQLCPGEKDSCGPYVCNDGTLVDRCTADGTVINYFAAPCLTHGGEVDASQSFSDVPSTHENAEAITYVKKQGIVEGYADGTYRPEQPINRAEFTKIIIGSNFTQRAMQYCVDFGFSDTSRTAWYAPFVCLAAQHRIIEGYPDGSFHPSTSITFVEAAKIIALVDNFYINGVYYNNMLSNGQIVGKPLPESLQGVWYESPVRYLAQKNAIPTSITHFDQPITRGEMAEMIYRLKTGNMHKESQTYEQLELNTRIETHGSISTFHHIDPAFSFQFPTGWTLSDDRGDRDIYIDTSNSDVRIILSYCDGECNGPLNECTDGYTKATVPTLATKGCLSVSEDGREEWTKIGVPVNGTYFFTVKGGTKDELREIWPVLAKIRTSLQTR